MGELQLGPCESMTLWICHKSKKIFRPDLEIGGPRKSELELANSTQSTQPAIDHGSGSCTIGHALHQDAAVTKSRDQAFAIAPADEVIVYS